MKYNVEKDSKKFYFGKQEDYQNIDLHIQPNFLIFYLFLNDQK